MANESILQMLRKNHHPQHCHPNSELFSGCDSLFSFLDQGWRITNFHICEYPTFSRKIINVYHIILTQNSQTTTLKIIHNPVVEQFFKHYPAIVQLDYSENPKFSQLLVS